MECLFFRFLFLNKWPLAAKIPYFYLVQFLYPIFLIAGLSLLIPIVIHLFNLRRYKTVFFPHTRFLKSLQLHSQKQSQVRYKWLLAARLLFLLFLILAFAQPFFAHQKGATSKKGLTAIFIDNSQSMSLRYGQRSMLDAAKENALHLIQSSSGRFLILSNDKPASYKPLSRQQAIEALSKIQFSAFSKNNTQVVSELNSMLQDVAAEKTDLYYLSDFQQAQFSAQPDLALLEKIRFNGVQIPQSNPQNVFIDTAFFESPVLHMGQSNQLIVRTRYSGDAPKEPIVLQLSVDGQIKSAAQPDFSSANQRYDTLTFQINNSGWQRIMLHINDANVHFDDSFAIAARSSPELSVLLLNEQQPNVFMQAALRSYEGFKVQEQNTNNIPTRFDGYNLLLLNGLTSISETLATTMLKALQNGQNVCLFLGEKADIARVNSGLATIGDIQITGFDTAAQVVSSVQSESRLVKDMFERIPNNVQLPFAQNHYQIKAGLSAQQQSIFSFRNGDPFFALYRIHKGQLYICATSPNARNGNFQSSYFFVPFLYQMASLAKGNSIFAINAGQKQPVFIQKVSGDERNLVHLKAEGTDIIPAQKAEGMGVQVFAGAVAQRFGFYNLSSQDKDTNLIAVNMNRSESDLTVWSLSTLKKNWNGKEMQWQVADAENKALTASQQSAFPLWKLCSILAFLMLGIETFLLSKNLKQKQAITS